MEAQECLTLSFVFIFHAVLFRREQKPFNQISDVVAEHVNGGGDDCSELLKISWGCWADLLGALT